MSSERRRLRAGQQVSEDAPYSSGYAHYRRADDGVLRFVEWCSIRLHPCDRADVLHRWHLTPALLAELNAQHPIMDRGSS